jgi:hypothetical protein
MAKELPYFKFEPAEWKFGRIQNQPKDAKIAFMDLICKYWHNLCQMTLEDAILDFGEENVRSLIKFKIIEVDSDQNIHVKFLDIQLEEINGKSIQASLAGKKSAELRASKVKGKLNKPSTTVERNPTDKIREEESIVDKKKEEKIRERKLAFASTLEPFKEKYGAEMLNAFYRYWSEPNKSMTKIKWELQQTWDVQGRLTTWASRDNNFGNDKKTSSSTAAVDITDGPEYLKHGNR